MFAFRRKLSWLQYLIVFLLLGIIGVEIYCALFNPLYYIGVAITCVLLLVILHKSEYVILKQDSLIYRKYLLWRRVHYSKINILFITKQSFSVGYAGGVYDYHDKNTKQKIGCIFFMKDISETDKKSLSNSFNMVSEWHNTYIDVKYKDCILKTIIAGGFNGEIYITNEMMEILGEEIKSILDKCGFDLSKLKIIAVNDEET